jgi:hypothetical protein
MAAGSGPLDRTCVIRHKTDELLVEQDDVSDGQTASPVEEVDQAQADFKPPSFPPGWCGLSRYAASQGSPQDNELFRCTVLAALETASFLDTSHGHNKEHSGALRDIYGKLPIPKPVLNAADIGLSAPIDKRWTSGRGREIVRVLRKLDLAGRR